MRNKPVDLSPDSEKMKFDSEPDKKQISIASHAQANAVMQNAACSQEMRKSADALEELVRSMGGFK